MIKILMRVVKKSKKRSDCGWKRCRKHVDELKRETLETDKRVEVDVYGAVRQNKGSRRIHNVSNAFLETRWRVFLAWRLLSETVLVLARHHHWLSHPVEQATLPLDLGYAGRPVVPLIGRIEGEKG